MDLILVALVLKYKQGMKVYEALQRKEQVTEKELAKAEAGMMKHNLCAITVLNDKYPDYGKEQYKPPFVLFTINDGDRLYLPEEIFINVTDKKGTKTNGKKKSK